MSTKSHAQDGQAVSKVTAATAIQDLPALMKVDEASTWTRQSEWMLRDRIRRGQIPVVRMGARILISREQLAAWIAGGGTQQQEVA